MTYVFSTEIGTVLAALNRASFAGIVSQPELMQAVGCQPPRLGGYLPTEVLGRVWNVTAHRMPALFAFAVGEEHRDTPVVYGRWGQAMDHAPTVRDRLVAGARLLYVHTDAPRWELRPRRDAFDFARMWRYTNTTSRGEAFATVSDMHEWLIVMQRGVAEPIRPRSITLASALYMALGRDEISALGGAFGLLSLMDDASIRFFFGGLRKLLRPGGRFFAAVEPFDRATLPRYKAKNYKFYSRPVHWYHEMARQAGLRSRPSDLLPAHRGDERSMMLGLLLER